MFGEDINYFRSEYDKNILIYGRETIYEPLDISYEELSYHLRQQKQIGLPVNSVCFGVKIGLKISVGVILIFESCRLKCQEVILSPCTPNQLLHISKTKCITCGLFIQLYLLYNIQESIVLRYWYMYISVYMKYLIC